MKIFQKTTFLLCPTITDYYIIQNWNYFIYRHIYTHSPQALQAFIVNYLFGPKQSIPRYISLYFVWERKHRGRRIVEYGLAGHWWCGWWEVVESTRRRLKDSLVNIDWPDFEPKYLSWTCLTRSKHNYCKNVEIPLKHPNISHLNLNW